jgi:hypothetical protein
VDDLKEIARSGVMGAPALVVNGKVRRWAVFPRSGHPEVAYTNGKGGCVMEIKYLDPAAPGVPGGKLVREAIQKRE